MPHVPASSALARFRVVDLTQVRAGPTAYRQLADWEDLPALLAEYTSSIDENAPLTIAAGKAIVAEILKPSLGLASRFFGRESLETQRRS